MFSSNSPKQVLLLSIMGLLLLEFVINVVLAIQASDRQLNVDNWKTSSQNEKSLGSRVEVNTVFGLKPEVNTDAEEAQRQKEAENAKRLAAEKAKKKAEEELNIGEDNIRLFGISVVDDERLAMFSIRHSSGAGEVIQLKEGEELVLQGGKSILSVGKVLTESVTLTVFSKNKSEKSSFNLVIFSYGI